MLHCGQAGPYDGFRFWRGLRFGQVEIHGLFRGAPPPDADELCKIIIKLNFCRFYNKIYINFTSFRGSASIKLGKSQKTWFKTILQIKFVHVYSIHM